MIQRNPLQNSEILRQGIRDLLGVCEIKENNLRICVWKESCFLKRSSENERPQSLNKTIRKYCFASSTAKLEGITNRNWFDTVGNFITNNTNFVYEIIRFPTVKYKFIYVFLASKYRFPNNRNHFFNQARQSFLFDFYVSGL